MKNRFRKVAVLMGGPSAEREVSLRSGAAIVAGLREAGYEVAAVDVAGRTLDMPAGIEAVFIALHGEFGEDGQLQCLLDRRGIPYTASGALSSRMAMDKIMTKLVFLAHGLPTPEFEILRRGARRTLPLPVVTKPVLQGSSLGVNIVFDEADWEHAFADTLHFGEEVLVEAYIEGRELTVGIVGEEPLPVVEIVAPRGNYNYQAKYTKGMTRYRVPAPLGDGLGHACQEAGLGAFRALNCRGMARVDIRAQADGRLFVLELNSIPGFTETSLLPMAAAAAGIGFSELCRRIMEGARAG